VSYLPPNTRAPFVSPSIYLPENDWEKVVRISDLFNEFAFAINSREIGIYSTNEIVTGEVWVNNRTTYRKVYYFPALLDPGTTAVAHGLGDISNFTFTNIYGTCRNAAGTLHENILGRIQFAAANLNVICAGGIYNGYSAVVVAEYLKS
jgi:hypothetical protein